MKSEQIETGTLHHWTPQEVSEALESASIVLIDVRTPQEFAFERIRGALLSPMQELDPAHMPRPIEGRPVVFHCGSGMRSRKMAELAMQAGWAEANHMEGGFGAWKKAGLTYIGTQMSTGAPKDMTPR
ncbi:rhodanese-like domain-containing protein [Pontibaca salina]|uniref:Rhodanese-like domain-containing protein n=1 Tax=Pontibaca salina TaxID=2795731 RepID=A0A934HHH7_9RHOB|nr:rhodanese-like domain-containing protein [Pontibaca salina]MBI6628264.1 rhodanese-like domain-containing protein [Pontibaca salina]